MSLAISFSTLFKDGGFGMAFGTENDKPIACPGP